MDLISLNPHDKLLDGRYCPQRVGEGAIPKGTSHRSLDPTPNTQDLHSPRPGPTTAASLHIPSSGRPLEPRTFPGPLPGKPKGLGGLETLKQAPRFIPEQMRNGKGRPVLGCKQLGPAEGRDKITSLLRTILQTEAHRPGGLGGRPGVFAENGTPGPGRAAEPGEGVARDEGQLLGCGALSPEETPPAALGTAGTQATRPGSPRPSGGSHFPGAPTVCGRHCAMCSQGCGQRQRASQGQKPSTASL